MKFITRYPGGFVNKKTKLGQEHVELTEKSQNPSPIQEGVQRTPPTDKQYSVHRKQIKMCNSQLTQC